MNDLISRQAAIDAWSENGFCYKGERVE